MKANGDDVDGGVGWLWEWHDDGDMVVTRWQWRGRVVTV
ncbi:hypothetical protein Tco_1433803, partial [Tanacetum coccineum]